MFTCQTKSQTRRSSEIWHGPLIAVVVFVTRVVIMAVIGVVRVLMVVIVVAIMVVRVFMVVIVVAIMVVRVFIMVIFVVIFTVRHLGRKYISPEIKEVFNHSAPKRDHVEVLS